MKPYIWMARYCLTTVIFGALPLALALQATVLRAETSQGEGQATLTDLKHGIKPYVFEASDGTTVEAELGEFHVPENRRRSDSRRIKLGYVRFPSTSPDPGPPIVYLAGGPGAGGVGTARGRRFPLFMALRGVADVIAFDQRGTGFSSHIPPCQAEEPFPTDRPGRYQELLAHMQSIASKCAREWAEAGIDLAGYNTVENANDLEDLRRVLGAEKLTLWGISYGSHLAFSAVRRHGDKIHRMVLASVEGPDDTVKRPGRHQAYLERLAAALERDEAARDAFPDFLGSMGRVFDRLAVKPKVVTVGDARLAIGRLELRLMTGFLLKNPDTAARVPGLFQLMDGGDFSAMAPYLLQMRKRLNVAYGMPEAMDCASGISPRRASLVAREKAQALLGLALNFPFPEICPSLGIEALGEDFRQPVQTDVPTLFLTGTLDGRTFPESAREILGGFSRGHQVVIEGAGHDLFMSLPEVTDVILAFLRNQPLPKTRLEVASPPFVD